MNKKYLIITLIVILVVIIVLILNIRKNNKNISKNSISTGDISNREIIRETSYNEITSQNQITLKDKKTGDKLITVNEDEEYRLKIYEIDPDYEELEVLPESDILEE